MALRGYTYIPSQQVLDYPSKNFLLHFKHPKPISRTPATHATVGEISCSPNIGKTRWHHSHSHYLAHIECHLLCLEFLSGISVAIQVAQKTSLLIQHDAKDTVAGWFTQAGQKARQPGSGLNCQLPCIEMSLEKGPATFHCHNGWRRFGNPKLPTVM